MGNVLLADLEVAEETFADFGGFPAEIDRYKITGLLGRGSMGVVLRAYDAVLGREVALKLLRLDAPSRNDVSDAESRVFARARFVTEARLMARLSHTNVIQVFDVGTWGEHVFLAMELVDGQTLDEWLEGNRTRAEILDVFRQAAEGLDAAHRAGIVHRDFKPNNVLVGIDGRVRVMDFGLAKLAGECSSPALRRSAIRQANRSSVSLSGADMVLTQAGMSVGTPAYMPPEQHYGRCLDGRSDQFAFCSALHEALHGVRPFEGTSPDALLEAKVNRKLRRRRRIPGWLSKIIDRGTEPKPEDRYPCMTDLLVALTRVRRTAMIRTFAMTLATIAILSSAAIPVVALVAG
jgi:serine/threonine protein kinase